MNTSTLLLQPTVFGDRNGTGGGGDSSEGVEINVLELRRRRPQDHTVTVLRRRRSDKSATHDTAPPSSTRLTTPLPYLPISLRLRLRRIACRRLPYGRLGSVQVAVEWALKNADKCPETCGFSKMVAQGFDDTNELIATGR